MSAPDVPTERRSPNAEEGTEASPRTVDQRIKATHAALRNTGIPMSANKVTRLVRTYTNRVERTGMPFADFLASNIILSAQHRTSAAEDLRRRINYDDHTGDDACTNVMSERGQRGRS